ncbi:MAG: NADH-quinone oxidoreductase subunit C [Sediminibacterium sp.]
MTKEEMTSWILGIEPTAVIDDTGEWLVVQLSAAPWRNFASSVRRGPPEMDFLFCLTAVDWKTHLAVVYHLRNTHTDETLVVKVQIDREHPDLATVSDIWRTAEFHEREAFEMFGINFSGHPDLRKLILPDDFEGFPMRKDFEDPVNMIKL